MSTDAEERSSFQTLGTCSSCVQLCKISRHSTIRRAMASPDVSRVGYLSSDRSRERWSAGIGRVWCASPPFPQSIGVEMSRLCWLSCVVERRADLTKEVLVRIGRCQVEDESSNRRSDTCGDLEEFEPDGADLSVGELGVGQCESS